MDWALKRKFVYASAAIITLIALTVFLLRDTLFPAPTCFDHRKNGYEVGVDCGGVCNLKCSQEVSPLVVVWAKAIRSGAGIYDLVAMINNNNIDNSSYGATTTFTLYDKQGRISTVISEITIPPLGGKFPVIIQNIPLPEPPSNVAATVTDGPHFGVKEVPSSPTVRVLDRRYEPGSIPRVYATIANTKRVEIMNLPVRVLLFDDKDNVYAVGQTVIPILPKEGIKEIVFTWNESLPFAPTRIGVYPIFNPFDAIGY